VILLYRSRFAIQHIRKETMEVKIKIRDNVTVLKPDGRLIGVAGREFRRVIQAQLRTASEPPKFLFDFAQVARMDSTAGGVDRFACFDCRGRRTDWSDKRQSVCPQHVCDGAADHGVRTVRERDGGDRFVTRIVGTTDAQQTNQNAHVD